MFFDQWSGLLRLLVVGSCTYVGLVALPRLSGKRTLSKMNAFDLVVTVALGSTLATVLLDPKIALAEGIAAFALLILLQYAVAWTGARWGMALALVKSEPALLYAGGRMLSDALRRERVAEVEVLAAVRSQGIGSLEQVDLVILGDRWEFHRDPGRPARRRLGDCAGAQPPRTE